MATGSRVRALAAHPGYSATNLQFHYGNPVVDRLMGLGNRIFAQSAEMGALPIVYAATQDLPGGSYVGPNGRSEKRGYPTLVGRSAEASDVAMAERLWKESEKLTGVRFPDSHHSATGGTSHRDRAVINQPTPSPRSWSTCYGRDAFFCWSPTARPTIRSEPSTRGTKFGRRACNVAVDRIGGFRCPLSPSAPRRQQRSGPPSALALVAGLLAAPASAAPIPDGAGLPGNPPTSSVTPGMTGQGLTVVRGATPQPFAVEVLGVLENGIGAGRDMIIIEASDLPGRQVISAGGGIWAGMSGSPVYINGKLLGAVATDSRSRPRRSAASHPRPTCSICSTFLRPPLAPVPPPPAPAAEGVAVGSRAEGHRGAG